MFNKLLIASIISSAISLRKTVRDSDFIVCGGRFENINATLTPQPPLVVGRETYMYLSFDVPDNIDNGYTVTSVAINGVTYPDIKSNLCANDYIIDAYYDPASLESYNKLSNNLTYYHYKNYEKFVGIDCPIRPGQYIQNSSFVIPNIEGQMKLKIQWFSTTATLLLCLKTFVDIIG